MNGRRCVVVYVEPVAARRFRVTCERHGVVATVSCRDDAARAQTRHRADAALMPLQSRVSFS